MAVAAQPGRVGCPRAALIVGVTSPSSPTDTPWSPCREGVSHEVVKLLQQQSSNKVRSPHLCPVVFAMDSALTTDTDDQMDKNKERSHLWGSPMARDLSWVCLPHNTSQSVTSGPLKPRSCVAHDH